MSASDDTKRCSRCKKRKPITEYGLNRATPTGIHYRCRQCVREARREDAAKCKADPDRHERRKARCRKWGARNQHRRSLRFLYGIDSDEYERMLAAQKGVCAVCGEPERLMKRGAVCKLAVDHDHETGEIRGLLCSRCNNLLGRAKDDPEILMKAARYLTRNLQVV